MSLPVPEHLRTDWLCYRLVTAGVATLREIDEHWSIHDVIDVNEALNLQERAQHMAQESAQARAKGVKR